MTSNASSAPTPIDVEAISARLAALEASREAREERIKLLEEENRWLKAQLFGRSSAGMAREAAWAAAKPGIEHLFLQYDSDTAAYAGHLAQANNLTSRAVAAARQTGEKETAALYMAVSSLREALVGNIADARLRASAALQASNGRNTEAVIALALALAGDVSQAQKLVNDMAERFPEDTIAQFNYLPTIRAAVAVAQNSPAKAIADLREASSYELGTPALLIFVDLYPVYVRSEAYLAARQGGRGGRIPENP